MDLGIHMDFINILNLLYGIFKFNSLGNLYRGLIISSTPLRLCYLRFG
jgi:hypothetical protein